MSIHYHNHESSCYRNSLLDTYEFTKLSVGGFDGTIEGRLFFFSLGKVGGFWLQKRKKTLTPTV